MEGRLPAGYPLGVETTALEYGNQSAVVENAIADSLPLPVAALTAEDGWLRAAVLECADQADQIGRALDNLNTDLRRASGGEALPRNRGDRPSARFLHAVDGTIRRLLAGLHTVGEDYDLLERAQQAWELTLHRAAVEEADSLVAAVPPRAVIGRKVKANGKESVFRSSKAMAVFRSRLRQILPRAVEARSTRGDAA